MRIDDVLRRPEGKRLEFKRDLSSVAPVMRTLVAFANTGGGQLVIGVADRTRDVVGVDDPLGSEERLANLIADRIAPRLLPEIEFLAWRDTQVMSVEVHLGESRPYHLIEEGPARGVYVRLGSTNRRADAALIEEMRRSAQRGSFDEEPLPGLGTDTIDRRSASEYFRTNRRLRRSDLRTLGWTTTHQGREVPTVGGVLLFGSTARTTFPDAWVQAGRFAGSDRTTILDTVEIDGPLPAMTDAAIGFVDRHLATGLVIAGLRHHKARPVPTVAVREAVVNAVVHADYSQTGAPLRIAVFDDRVEIENPGLLPFGMTVDDMRGGVSRVRNRVIARTFRELGFIEQWGSGVPRMTNACRQAGLPDPVIEELAGRVRVTLHAVHATAPELDALDRIILDELRGSGGLTTAAVARAIGRTPRATRTRLLDLIERRLVVEVGSSRTDPRRRYFLATAEEA